MCVVSREVKTERLSFLQRSKSAVVCGPVVYSVHPDSTSTVASKHNTCLMCVNFRENSVCLLSLSVTFISNFLP